MFGVIIFILLREKINRHIELQEESNFLLKKILEKIADQTQKKDTITNDTRISAIEKTENVDPKILERIANFLPDKDE